MSEFETIVTCVFVLVYSVLVYAAGRVDFLDLSIKILESKAKELEEALKDDDKEVK